MEPGNGFMAGILTRIARRFAVRDQLSGTMKAGSALDSEQLQQLRNFFGLNPIRINGKNEVHIHFDIALQDAPEQFWLDRIGDALGAPLRRDTATDVNVAGDTLLSRLQLAFPALDKLTSGLRENPAELKRVFARYDETAATEFCFQLAETIQFLVTNNEPVTLSELGARFFRDSKTLRHGEPLTLLRQWLLFYADLEQTEGEGLLERFNVYHDRLTVNAVIYGPVVYTAHGRKYDWIHQLHRQGEPATLGWVNLQHLESMRWAEENGTQPRLICCENEAPFSRLIREQPNDAILFTSGFANSAVRRIYALLAPQAARCLHWGDTDPNGLRIAAILHAIFPLGLYRCDTATINEHEKLLLPLTGKHRKIAREMCKNGDFPFLEELLLTLEKGWLEQESWRG